LRSLEWKFLRQSSRQDQPREQPWWKSTLLAGAAAVFTALLGYWTGVLSESRQQETYERRLYLEQRMKLFVSTSADFVGYLENWERLNTIARVEAKQALDKEGRERKSRYEKDRTAARERLWVDLEQARLFYSPAVAEKIASFQKYFEAHKNATIGQMPPKDEYLAHKDAVLGAMRDEVKGGTR
jgi:hypothetical protein